MTFTNPTSDKELISNINNELKKLLTKRKNNPIKMGYRDISTDEYKMTETQLRKCSTSLSIREMQIKTTLRFHLIPARTPKMKNIDDSLHWREWGIKGTLLHYWVSANWYSCFENQYGDFSEN